MVLDMYDFCKDAYKQDLSGPRATWQAANDASASLERAAKKAKAKVTVAYCDRGFMHVKGAEMVF